MCACVFVRVCLWYVRTHVFNGSRLRCYAIPCAAMPCHDMPGVGIELNGCGAGYVHDSWVGQYEAGDKKPRNLANATCILFDGGYV